jgi:DNA-binding CsgD family transcriptional regulator
VDLDRYISLGTEKQQELLELMKLGHAQADAAEILNISQSTANARILSFKKRLTNLNY